ncbi:hypothetical protein [uncultured Amnibacterium sp.]|uniref:hypothetical protein n=1 Tax=uncultured Amnibacterium sp. TaxID=1631851 RepID=UPI0035CB553A
MSDPQRRQVRVRRSPKVGVFLGIGAVVGALVAVVAVNVTPSDDTTPKVQAIAFLILLLAPVGALAGGVVALLIDAVLERRAKTVEAERLPTAPPSAPPAAAPPAGDAPPAAGDAPPPAGDSEPAEAVEQDLPDRS